MPNLLVHGHEVEVVPGLNNLSIVDPDDRNAGELDRRLRRSSSHEVSFVLTTHGATRSDFITFSNHILDNDHYVREGLAECCVKRSVVPRPFYRLRRII